MEYVVSGKAWRFFQDVVVPAVLGNTAWAVLSMLVGTGLHLDTIARSLLLAAITAFLLGDWVGGDSKPQIGSRLFGLASTLFYASIAAYAIAHAYATPSSDLSHWMLGIFFAVTGLGHFAGAWTRDEERHNSSKKAGRRNLMVGCVVSIVVLILGSADAWGAFSGDLASLWAQIIAMIIFGALWYQFRFRS